ncbi:hypothetical protein P3X46_032015 [Hevea brasiliensis]|uniref:Uncharacterized protein n=1 Tax=Hevea brasiliensis TaxID=3981 RepID=A0ABQ9KQ63_HEVBR|nr:hypothetical protein P3X46_032015 [Hevea brasiliensis]
MFESRQWVASKYGQASSGPSYEKAEQIMVIQELLLKVLRLVDGDEKLIMGFIYEIVERTKLTNHKNFKGSFLNLQYQYGPHDIGNDNEIILSLKNTILYRHRMRSFGIALVQKPIKFTNPVMHLMLIII